MADPVSGTLNYPCDACEAKAGEECAEDCPLLNDGNPVPDFSELDINYADSWAEYVVPPLEESEEKLMAAVHRLPFGRLAGEVPQRTTMSRELWMAQLAAWMTDYRSVLVAQIADLETQSRQRISLQLERDVVRRFLGSTCSSTPMISSTTTPIREG
jgi:hypothetical protein